MRDAARISASEASVGTVWMIITKNGEKVLGSTLSPRYQRSIMPSAPPSPGPTAGCEF